MKAKEIKDLYNGKAVITDEALTLIYDKSNGTYATGVANLKEAIGVTLDGITVTTTVDESKLANDDNQLELEIKESSSGLNNSHKSYEVNATLPKIVSVSEIEDREIEIGSEELLQGGHEVTIHTSDERLVPSKSIILKNGKEVVFAEKQNASVKSVSSTAQTKVTITTNKESPIDNKEFNFDFEIPVAQGVSNIKVKQNDNSGEFSSVKFGYGNITENEGELHTEYEESLKIRNGNDGYGYFKLEVGADGHLYQYYQEGKETPEFEVGEDGHLYALLDTEDDVVKKDLGSVVNKTSTEILEVEKIPEKTENVIYIVKNCIEFIEA